MCPSGVDIVVHRLKSSCSGIGWYMCFRCNTMKVRFFCYFCRTELINGNEYQ